MALMVNQRLAHWEREPHVFSAQGLTWSKCFSPNGHSGWGQREWANGWIDDGQTDGRLDRRMDGWTRGGMTESLFIQPEWAVRARRQWELRGENEAFISLMSGREQTRGRRGRSFILGYWQLPIFYPSSPTPTLISPSTSLPPSLPRSLTAASYKVEENCMAHKEWWQIDCTVVMARVMGGWQMIGLD